MIRNSALTAALILATTPALAGGITRIPQSVGILFEEGRYVEFGIVGVSPDVSGTFTHPLAGRLQSGDVLPGFGALSLSYKQAINDQIDAAIILDEGYGADTGYRLAGYPLTGTTARLDSIVLTGLLRYKLPQQFSVIGGLRLARTDGEVAIPTYGYSMSTDTQTDLGYVLGFAWEKPEIAARVSLTYNSKITHDFDVTENGASSPDISSSLPQSVVLEFQTGVAADTLAFGSVRWTDWTDFQISPAVYTSMFGTDLVGYESDSVAVELGLGRKLTENFSAAVTVGWEGASDDPGSNLAPYDGEKSIGIGGMWTQENVVIQGGLKYIELGDTNTQMLNAEFRDNTAVAGGLRVGYRF